MKKLHPLAAAALAASLLVSLLTACGDTYTEDTSPVELTEVPASATVSVTSYTQFTASLMSSETGTPLGVNSATPPVSESELPITF